jgi:hypothetical protein
MDAFHGVPVELMSQAALGVQQWLAANPGSAQLLAPAAQPHPHTGPVPAPASSQQGAGPSQPLGLNYNGGRTAVQLEGNLTSVFASIDQDEKDDECY